MFCKFCLHVGYDLEAESVDRFRESYSGSAKSLVDWCHDFLEETGHLESIPENLRGYFNIEAFARDMEINDLYTVTQGSAIHVFWNP